MQITFIKTLEFNGQIVKWRAEVSVEKDEPLTLETMEFVAAFVASKRKQPDAE